MTRLKLWSVLYVLLLLALGSQLTVLYLNITEQITHSSFALTIYLLCTTACTLPFIGWVHELVRKHMYTAILK